MQIIYKLNSPVTVDDFASLLRASGLAERRPIDDNECLQGMLNNSNLILTAWHDEKLIGIARCMSDFHYACYLSDLAVDAYYQKHGIGKQLQRQVQKQLGPKCKLILVAAPDADSYYSHIGFEKNTRCWVLEPDEVIR